MARRKKVPSDEQTIKKEQETNTGIMISAGEIQANNNDNISWSSLQSDYDKIRKSDPLITSAVDILKYPILMSEYRIESRNKEVSDYVYWVLDNLKKGFGYYKYHKLLSLDYGLSMHEMVIKYGDRYNGRLTNRPIWFNPIQNETIDWFYYDEFTEFTGIKHRKRMPDNGETLIDIGADKLDYMSYNEEYNDIRGRSVFRTIRYFWDCKHKIIGAKTTAIQRGTGIVGIKTKGILSNEDQGKLENIGRTIANLKNGYYLIDEEKASVELMELKGQQDISTFIDYLDRQMFYNTLTQFMTSGIAGNGSRAATGEHKNTYEMIASYILQLLEDNLQIVIDKIIDMSCYAKTSDEDWPLIKFNQVKSVDLTRTAQQISSLAQVGFIKYTQEDEKFIRQLFGMPEIVVEAPATDMMSKKLSKEKNRKLSQELLDWEYEHFSLESANEHYETVSDKAKMVIESYTKEYLKEVYEQLKTDRTKDIKVPNRIINEAVNDLKEIYNTGFERGQKDVKKEVSKLKNGNTVLSRPKTVKLQNEPGKMFEKNIKNFFFRIKNVIENKMNVVTDQYIENKGGLNQVIMGYEMGFKSDKNNIVNDVENSYTEGRGETLLELSDEIETYFYTATMDRNLCEHCAPLDGLILTKQEVEDNGLNIGSGSINPDCLGGTNCRCQLMVYSLK